MPDDNRTAAGCQHLQNFPTEGSDALLGEMVPDADAIALRVDGIAAAQE